MVIQWTNAADDDFIAAWASKTLSAFDVKTLASGNYYTFCYLYDAAYGEDVFKFYGQGTSLPKLKSVRQQYDPESIFQSLQPGGFKVGT